MATANVSKVVVMGASWGGIAAFGQILSALPSNFPAAILLVQHQRPDSGNRLATLLQRKTAMPVGIPAEKEEIKSGHIYVAAPGYHMLTEKGGEISYALTPPVHFSRPAIDELFFSAGYAFGERLIGVLLTGANEDGAAGLAYIRRRGGFTMAQDPATAEAAAMPQAAIDLQAVMQVAALDDIQRILIKKVTG